MNPAFPDISVARHSVSELSGLYDDASFAALVKDSTAGSDTWVFLRSSGDAGLARYSIAGWAPLLVFEGKNKSVAITGPGTGTAVWEGLNILDAFTALFEEVDHALSLDVAPFSGGFMGYFAYDIKNSIERLPRTAVDDLNLPDVFQIFPGEILIHDRKERRVTGMTLGGSIEWERQPHGALPEWSALGPERRRASAPQMTETGYKSAVQRIREYIRNGDVYQANLAQRFAFPAPADPWEFWIDLYTQNPAPYFAYIHSPSHRVLCTSMERCVRRQGGALRSEPIKGTRPRGGTAMEDAALIAELRNDPKENAELSMIVDLVRNDLSRVCTPRTVRVTEHARLDSYENVHHLSSVIDGKLRAGVPIAEMLKALLPAGSITGCPKIRAMEIIDELEPVQRHVYTGSIGYIGLHGTMDMNVAIRTAVCTADTMVVSFGSGIVYDSDPAREYQETLDKGETFFTLIHNLQQ